MNRFLVLLAAVAAHTLAGPGDPCDIRAFSGNFLFVLNSYGVTWWNINDYETNQQMNDAIDEGLKKLEEEHKNAAPAFREMKLFYSKHYQHSVVTGVNVSSNEFHIGVVPLTQAVNESSHFYPFSKMDIGPYTLEDGSVGRLLRLPPNVAPTEAQKQNLILSCKQHFMKSIFNRIYFGHDLYVIVDPVHRAASVSPHNITEFQGPCPADTYNSDLIENQNEDDRDFHIVAKKIDGFYQIIFESRDAAKDNHTCLLRQSGSGRSEEARMLMYPREHGERGVSVHFPKQ